MLKFDEPQPIYAYKLQAYKKEYGLAIESQIFVFGLTC